MKLTQLFGSEKQTGDKEVARNRVSGGGGNISPDRMTAEGNRQARALLPGQTIRGEVLARMGNEIQIKLAGDMLLNARVDRSINLELGKYVTFQVKNNGASLMLSPLFENMATDANVLKALDMAGLPANETTVAMTEKLMEGGLPIDKNTLMQVYREVSAFSQAAIADIVDLHRIGIPVEENNLNQIASYKNLTYQLGEGMKQLAEALPKVLADMVQEGNAEGAAKLWQELVTVLSEGGYESGCETGYGAGYESGHVKENGQLLQNGAQVQGAVSPENGSLPVDEIFGQKGEQVSNKDLSGSAENADRLQDVKNPVSSLNFSGNDTIDLVSRMFAALSQGGAAEEKTLKALYRLLSGKNLRDALDAGFMKEFTVTPEEVAEPKAVEQLYERMDRQIRNLGKALEEAGQSSSQAFKTAGNLSRNLDFLQQVNHIYTYVQLPLRLRQSRAHGDLYVFTNKKNLASRDGKVSALLHLDMEHLGPVDVYVSMEQERVGTKFYVKNEEMLDFLEQHMDILTERLQKRGFACSFSMEIRESGEEAGGIRQLLQKEGHVPLSQYAFDMRA